MNTEAETKAQEAGELKYRLFPSVRMIFVMLVGIGVGTMMITRFNVSIAVVCMVDDDVTEGVMTSAGDGMGNATRDIAITNGGDLEVSTAGKGRGEFQWDKTFQGLLLSSYFYGYTAGLVPGGWIADKLPVVLVLLVSIGLQGLWTLVLPVVARTDPYLLLALRALHGLCSSAALPAAQVFARNWSVPVEYTTVFSLCWAFQYLLGGSAYPISSSICQAWGWPAVFYITGAFPILWMVVGWFLLTSSPDESSICSEDEKRYLASKRLFRVATTKSLSDKSVTQESTPILAIITNRQVLIVIGTFFTNSWFYYALNITLPTFLKETMGVNLTENGFLSGLPTMSMTVGCVAGGKVFQYLLTRWQCSRTNARKIIATVAFLIPAVLLGAILLLPPGMTYLTMSLLVLCNVTSVLGVAGGPLSAGPDIAPQFAGVIWGLSGSIGNLTGVLAPTIAAAMTPNKTLLEWRYFFLIALVMNVVMDLAVILFWKSEVQTFAKTEDIRTETQNGDTCKA
ncbi:sialin-like [Amphibalanus amphitrite]|uniref:sialin-like n=1 Tax=Amphibalanus amphitrite TaxID=1232801 RepID=UPI001C8FD5F2|nr:sialin-like [Amphibalanus amphitrite]XP_043203739.1 sialin-like [Amphibalanus amphitrite]XP_043203740.1 sialin-like [Amphibalanus amphitrite]